MQKTKLPFFRILSHDKNKNRNCGVEIDVRKELNPDLPVICDTDNYVNELLPSMWKIKQRIMSF